MKVTNALENKVNKLIELFNDKQVMELFSEEPEEVRKLCRKLSEIEEGKLYYNELTINQVINEWDCRSELYYLVKESFESLSLADREDFIKKYRYLLFNNLDNYPSVNNKNFFKDILNLIDYSNRDDIIKRLNELI